MSAGSNQRLDRELDALEFDHLECDPARTTDIMAAKLPATDKLVLLTLFLLSTEQKWKDASNLILAAEKHVVAYGRQRRAGYPTIDVTTLAKVCSLHRVSCQRALSRLEKAGVLAPTDGGGRRIAFEFLKPQEEGLSFWAMSVMAKVADREYGQWMLDKVTTIGKLHARRYDAK